MNGIFENIVKGTIVEQALFVMVVGLAGVFLVLTVFFGLIFFLERFFRPKNGENAGA